MYAYLRLSLSRIIVFIALLIPCFSGINFAQVSVLTHHNDNSRTGQNLSETYLTPTVVNNQGFGQLFAQPLDGIAVAEPLYVPLLQVNGATHNVVFVATLHDGVYAFDADNSAGSNASPLWYTSLINPPSVTTVPLSDQGCVGHGITEMGILGTPVIDPATNTMYLVAKTLENGSYVFRLHALNILTGKEALGGPVAIAGSYTSQGQVVTFVQQHRMNRPALLLSNGVIYIAFGTMGCSGFPPSTGWMMAYSAATLDQLAVLDVGPGQSATPGIWMSGAGPSVDGSGNVYVATGDGIFDFGTGGLDYGDTVMKINLTGGDLDMVDYFTPYNQAFLDQNDLDLGSGGILLLPLRPGPNPNLGVVAGKEGTIYLMNQDNLGGYNPLADQVVEEVPFSPTSTVNLFGGAAYWNNEVFFGSGTGNLPVEMFSLSNGLLSTAPAATTAKRYNIFSLFSISANGAKNGILWAVNQQKTTSNLLAFNATNLALLFESPSFEETLHFVTPMIANGKVYVTTQNSLVVMGLLARNLIAQGNQQTALAGTKLATPLVVRVTNAYTGSPMPGVSIAFSDSGAGGKFSIPNAITNSAGYAGTFYTLPANAGVYRISATGSGITSPNFIETATTSN